MRRTCTFTTVFVALLAWAPSAQQTTPPPKPQQPGLTFRSVANYVEVDAIVTDGDGGVVKDLKATDFEVTEDGRPQALSVCAFVDIPVEKADPLLVQEKATEPDVFTNEKPFDGRVFMLVLDGYHVNALRSLHVRREARTFIERYLGENDLAAVVHIGSPADGQEFTSSKRLLLASIEKFKGQALPSPTQAVIQDALSKEIALNSGINSGAPTDMEAPARSFQAQQSLDSMRRLSEYMGAMSGRRKALLFFSEGIEYDIRDTPTNSTAGRLLQVRDGGAVRAAQEVMVGAASAANVSIYSIDPRGSTNGVEEFPGKLPLADGPYGFLTRDVLAMAGDDLSRAQDSLRRFSDQTGGLALLNQNDMDAAFRRVIDDNSAYYVLGYTSPEAKRDGKFHRLVVKVKRQGLLVRAKYGYHSPNDKGKAPPVKPPDVVNQTLGNPAQLSGLGMRVSAGAIKGLMLKSTVHLTVEFNGRDIPLQETGGIFANDIDVKYLAVDMSGQQQAAHRENAKLRLNPDRKAAFPDNGMRWISEFELAPGRYQVRVAARELNGGKMGSVFVDIDVPDLATLPIGMSDILLTSTAASRASMGSSPTPLSNLLPSPTITAREFSRADTITALTAFYDNVTTATHTVDLKATVMSDTGAKIFQKDEARDSKDLNSAKGGYRWTMPIPLKDAAPGRYVLMVEARCRLGPGDVVKREVEFRIR